MNYQNITSFINTHSRLIKSIILVVVIAIAAYLVIPKYNYYVYANGNQITRCNAITGSCDAKNIGKNIWTKLAR